MPNEVKWIAPTSRTTGIATATINSGAGALGSEIDNETNLDRFCNIMITIEHAVAPTADRSWLVYIVYDLTSADYEDGSASVQPKKSPVMAYPVKADTNAQQAVATGIPLAPFAFKIILWNDTDQNSDTSLCTVLCETYNEEIQ